MKSLRRFLSLCIVSVYILGASLSLFAQDFENMTAEEYQQWKETQRPDYSLNSPLPLLSNDYIGLSVEAVNGRFTVGATGGDPTNPNDNNKVLLYGHPRPWSSFTTIRVDGADYRYGDSPGSFTTQPYNSASGVFNKSVWKVGNIQVTQTLTIVNNLSTNRRKGGRESFWGLPLRLTVDARLYLFTIFSCHSGEPKGRPRFTHLRKGSSSSSFINSLNYS